MSLLPRHPADATAAGGAASRRQQRRHRRHDQQTAELARYKLGVHAADDADGYRRDARPAATGKIRCPLRPASMTLDRDRPEILSPPQHPPPAAPSRPSPPAPKSPKKPGRSTTTPHQAWRISYRRRTAAERLNAAIKDTATNNIDRGWIRLMGVTPLMLSLACLMAVRNQRILLARDKQQQDNAQPAPASTPPRTRKRRRTSLAALAPGPP